MKYCKCKKPNLNPCEPGNPYCYECHTLINIKIIKYCKCKAKDTPIYKDDKFICEKCKKLRKMI